MVIQSRSIYLFFCIGTDMTTSLLSYNTSSNLCLLLSIIHGCLKNFSYLMIKHLTLIKVWLGVSANSQFLLFTQRCVWLKNLIRLVRLLSALLFFFFYCLCDSLLRFYFLTLFFNLSWFYIMLLITPTILNNFISLILRLLWIWGTFFLLGMRFWKMIELKDHELFYFLQLINHNLTSLPH